MNIRSSLRLNYLIGALVFLISIIVLGWVYNDVIRAEKKEGLIASMRKVALERQVLRDDYFSSGLERPRLQWLAKTDEFRGLLQRAKNRLTLSDDRILLEEVEKNFLATVAVFSKISETRTGRALSADRTLLSQIERRRIARIRLAAFMLRDDLAKLEEKSDAEVDAAHNRALLLLIFIIILSYLAIIGNTSMLVRKLPSRISMFREGTKIIGDGNLDYRLEILGNDELSDLARRINEMVARLQQSFTTIDLQNGEIETRIRAESELINSKDLLSETQRVGQIGGWDWNAVNDVIWWSDEYFRIYGIDPAKPTPTYSEHLKVYTIESAERLDLAVKKAMEAGSPYELDLELANPTGSTQWIRARGEAKKNEAGRIIGLRGTAQNITQRKQAEHDLARLVFAFNHVGEEILLVDKDANIHFVNDTACWALGYSRDELLKLRISDIDPDFQIEVWPDHWQEVQKRGSLCFESRHRAKDGRIYPVDVSSNYFEYMGRGYIFGTARDITERKQAEEALQESQAFVKKVLNTVDEGFIVVDRDFKIISANRAYCKFSGADAEQVTGRPCYEVSHHIERPCFKSGEDCPVEQVFRTGKSAIASHSHRHNDGLVHFVELKAFPILSTAGTVISAIETITDVTEKKRLEDQLHHAQKLESLGTLAGGVAHDFNNILNVIVGYSSMMEMHLSNDDPNMPYLREILAASERATHLTQALLIFSRKQRAVMKPLSINTLIEGMKKMMLRLIGEDIETCFSLAPENLMVVGDYGQLEQVLMNFATNARDAMPDGGTLSIETRPYTVDSEFIRVHGYGQPGEYVMISVADTGVGIDKKTQEKIFEPFFTTKGVGKGTGLGLSIVYGIVKQHHGYVNCYSEPGSGTTFKVYFPVIKEEMIELEESEKAEIIGGDETILVADDDESIRRLVRELLEKFGYTVIDATDGADAVRKFIDHRERVDLVLLDVIMPRKSGREAFDEIKSIEPDAKILFMSGYTEDIIQRKRIIEDNQMLLQKPVKPKELMDKIREILDGKK